MQECKTNLSRINQRPPNLHRWKYGLGFIREIREII